MFRREFGQLPSLVRAVAEGDTARADLVGGHIQLLCALLHSHHSGEDELLWPRLLERGSDEIAPIVHLAEAQHEAVDKGITDINEALPMWRSTASVAGRDGIGDAVERLYGPLVEHLDMEEQQILPLAEKYVTAAEWQELGQHSMAGLPKNRLPLLFGMTMYEGDPEVMKEIIATMPLLPRLLMPTLAPRLFASYAKRIHGTSTPNRVASR
ncbi:hemerythrin domain-containing protein [Micromonospora sp. NBC_01796]|uniref:hemerythrin domain-containing protein n=1 Tax=Micromonospora sp. NBC_01796 TaxID=2975987 RepID=UPI002DD99928|nr:hemerythrin domain-containing protein [Micromonospora sp. NBC_01796]WSA87953.1 hemerythrin domain-containing protein [Micromonospora sp. NBC_01796]